MVSPVDKNGGSIQSFGANFGGGVIQAAAQGSTVTYTSASSFQNPQGAPGRRPVHLTQGRLGLEHGERHPPGVSGSYPGDPVSGVPVPALLRRPELCAAQQRPPLPQVRDETVPGRKPAAGGVGSPGGLPQLLRARQLGRDLRSAAVERRPRRPELGAEDFELAFVGATPELAHVVLSSCAALTANATEVAGTEGECDRPSRTSM